MLDNTPARLIKLISKVKLLASFLLMLALSLFIVELYAITRRTWSLYTFIVSTG